MLAKEINDWMYWKYNISVKIIDGIVLLIGKNWLVLKWYLSLFQSNCTAEANNFPHKETNLVPWNTTFFRKIVVYHQLVFFAMHPLKILNTIFCTAQVLSPKGVWDIDAEWSPI